MENLNNNQQLEGELNQVENGNSVSFEDTLKLIDENKNNEIDHTELENALKPDGFFSKEGNIKAIASELNKYSQSEIEQYYKGLKQTNENLWKILKSFNKELSKIVSDLLKKEKANEGSLTDSEIKIMQLREIMFGRAINVKIINKKLQGRLNGTLGGYYESATNEVQGNINQYVDNQEFMEKIYNLWGEYDENIYQSFWERQNNKEVFDEVISRITILTEEEQILLKNQLGAGDTIDEYINNLVNNFKEAVATADDAMLVIYYKLLGEDGFCLIPGDITSEKEKIETVVERKILLYNTIIRSFPESNKLIIKNNIGDSIITKTNFVDIDKKLESYINNILYSDNVENIQMDEDQKILSTLYYRLLGEDKNNNISKIETIIFNKYKERVNSLTGDEKKIYEKVMGEYDITSMNIKEFEEHINGKLGGIVKEICSKPIQEDDGEKIKFMKIWDKICGSENPALKDMVVGELYDAIQKYANYNISSFGMECIKKYTNLIKDFYPEKYDEYEIAEVIQFCEFILGINSSEEEVLSSPIKCLEDLGIDGKQIFNWENLKNDIKTVDDVDKINSDNIKKYIDIPEEVPQENYIYIVNNIKSILKRHLTIFKGYKSIFSENKFATGLTIEGMVENDKYVENMIIDINEKIETKSETEQINIITGKLKNGELSDAQYVHMWVNLYLGEKSDEDQEKILEKIFDKFPESDIDKFLNVCKKDELLKKLREPYMTYRLNKENALFFYKSNGKESFMLDFSKKNKFKNFKGKGLKISDSNSFDTIYEKTEEFYDGLKGILIDESIPLIDIVNLLIIQNDTIVKNDDLRRQYQSNIKSIENRQSELENHAMLNVPCDPQVGRSQSAAQGYGFTEKRTAELSYKRQVFENCVKLEEEYAKLLKKRKPQPSGQVPGISKGGLMLDFTKGDKPKDIVRDKFGEKCKDQWDTFVYNIGYDWKAALGSAAGMVTGIVLAGLSCFEGNVLAASAAFTIGSRLGNGVTQEILNTSQYLAEKITGNEAKGGNQVNKFGESFMKGIGAYEPIMDKITGQPILDENGKIQYQFIGWDRFTSNLFFDYVGGVVMFGAFKALGPGFDAIKSINVLGKPLEFASKWLFFQNFCIDMPMNALHKGTDVFLGIGGPQQKYHGSILYSHNDGGQNPKGDEHYESGNIGDAFEAMLGNIEEHLSFENQAQVFLNTLLYCGMLEAGQGLFSRIKSYMPVARVEKYTRATEKFEKSKKEFISEIEKAGLTLNENLELVDRKTGKKLKRGDEKFGKFKAPLKKLKIEFSEYTKATVDLIESEKLLSKDGNNKYSILRDCGLLSDKKPPLDILKDKINDAKKQHADALKSGDTKKAEALEQVIQMYQSAQIALLTVVHPESINNMKLGPQERIAKAKELLGNKDLTADQEQAILEAHEASGDAYSLSYHEVAERARILLKAGFTEVEVKILMKNCICGKMKGVGSGTAKVGSEDGPAGEGTRINEGGEGTRINEGGEGTRVWTESEIKADLKEKIEGIDKLQGTSELFEKYYQKKYKDAGQGEKQKFGEILFEAYEYKNSFMETNKIELDNNQAKRDQTVLNIIDKIKKGDPKSFNENFKTLMDEYSQSITFLEGKLKGLKKQLKDKAYEDGVEFDDVFDSSFKKFRNELYQQYTRNKFDNCYELYSEHMAGFKAKWRELKLSKSGETAKIEELENFMVEQYELLLQKGPYVLDGIVDIKGTKKGIKGIYGREIPLGLENILGKAMKDKNFNQEDIKQAIDEMSGENGFSKKLAKELFGDENIEWTVENLQEAILRVEIRLEDYYKIIDKVFDPEIEFIRWGNDLGAIMEQGFYREGENYSKETPKHKRDRMENESKMRKEVIQKNSHDEISIQLGKYLDRICNEKEVDLNGEVTNYKVLSETEANQIKKLVESVVKGCKDCGYGVDATYDICKICLDFITYQTVESSTRSMGDHGVNHIAGNIERVNGYIDRWVDQGGNLGKGINQNKDLGKFIGTIIQIFHDPGYAARISKGSGHFDGSQFHPTTSKKMFESLVKPLLESGPLKEHVDLISDAIGSHDGTYIDRENNPIGTMIHLADNMAIGVDKFQEMMPDPAIAPYLPALCQWKGDIEGGKKYIEEKIKDSGMPEERQNALISALREFNSRSFDNLGFYSIQGRNTLTINQETGIKTVTYYEAKYGGDKWGVNGLDLEAKMRGMDVAKLNSAIENAKMQGETGINNLTKLLETEFKKWGDQITKPWGDYGERYNVRVEVGGEYKEIPRLDENGKPRVDEQNQAIRDGKGKVDTNRIKAYLLAGYPIEFVTNTNQVKLKVEFKRAGEETPTTELGNNAYDINKSVETTTEVLDTYFSGVEQLNICTIENKAGKVLGDFKNIKTFIETGRLPEGKSIVDIRDETVGHLLDLEKALMPQSDGKTFKSECTKIEQMTEKIKGRDCKQELDIKNMENILNYDLLTSILSVVGSTTPGQ